MVKKRHFSQRNLVLLISYISLQFYNKTGFATIYLTYPTSFMYIDNNLNTNKPLLIINALEKISFLLEITHSCNFTKSVVAVLFESLF